MWSRLLRQDRSAEARCETIRRDHIQTPSGYTDEGRRLKVEASPCGRDSLLRPVRSIPASCAGSGSWMDASAVKGASAKNSQTALKDGQHSTFRLSSIS